MPTEVFEHETNTSQTYRANILGMGSVEETGFYSDIIVISSNNLYGLTKEHLQTIMTKLEELFECPSVETNRDDATKFMGPKGMRK